MLKSRGPYQGDLTSSHKWAPTTTMSHQYISTSYLKMFYGYCPTILWCQTKYVEGVLRLDFFRVLPPRLQSFLIQYIYNWRCTKTNPCLRVFLARLNNVYQLETIITKSNKTSFHLWKWQALLRAVTQLRINTCYGLVVLILSLCVVCAVHACVSYLFIIFENCNVGNVNKN